MVVFRVVWRALRRTVRVWWRVSFLVCLVVVALLFGQLLMANRALRNFGR
jgi:hypothetical protein